VIEKNGRGFLEHKESVFSFRIARWRKIAMSQAPGLVGDLAYGDAQMSLLHAKDLAGGSGLAAITRARNWLKRNRVWIVRDARKTAKTLTSRTTRWPR
jgi:hypothetical protein